MPTKEFSLRVPASCRPGDEHKTQRAFSESVEEYVEGIYKLQRDVGRVTTGDLAAYMMVSAGSATTMIKKMAELGLVQHEPYQGILLTEFGAKVAKQLLRAHRILEVFLVYNVGVPWNDVHELACKLEHYISEEIIGLIEAKMDFPKTCPHGNPVDCDAVDLSVRLQDATTGRLKMVRVSNERVEFLMYLEELGLLPGTEFEATGSTKIDSLIHLNVAGKPHTVGMEVARHVWVVPA